MRDAATKPSEIHLVEHYPPGFRRRRFRNWFFLGLLYAGYYLNRYNFGPVAADMAREFGWSNAETGAISSARDLGYAIGTFANGLVADALGGKWSMLIGAAGTLVLNLLFGWFSTWDVAYLLTGLVTIRAIDGYLQSFGSPGMVKINTAWFRRSERGTFAGIFGMMIQLGQMGANYLPSVLLPTLTVVLFGVTFWAKPAYNWRTMFFVPPILLAGILICMLFAVKNTPEAAGHHVEQDADEDQDGKSREKLPLLVVFTRILTHPLIWVNAAAYLCTGFVRRSYDLWWAKYLDNSWHITKETRAYRVMAIALPAAAVAGSFTAGFLSDKFFKSRRSPVAAALYGLESLVILVGVLMMSQPAFASPLLACVFLFLISVTCNSSHSIIGTAAVMDIGGRRMAGFALGVVNSFQYLGTIVAGIGLGKLIDDHGWNALFWAMLPFSTFGAILMCATWWRTRGRDVRGA
ncbi:MAG: MFS transporter [Planctomycetes bacterium]|nr:MFS transporter [Planctomycetota bacterium]